MSELELRSLANLLEKMVRHEALADSERKAAAKLAEEADRLADRRAAGAVA